MKLTIPSTTTMHLVAFLCLFSIWLLSPSVNASWGDQHPVFQNYRRHCLNMNCSTDAKLTRFNTRQPLSMRLLGWDCSSECTYESMWHLTHKALEEVERVPQFYGKWPFVRFMGMQEPASCIFSILNGAVAVYMLSRFRRQVPSNAPMYEAWHGYFAVQINTWVWSTVFHFRDVTWTEKMDYISAFSLIVSGMLMFILRVFSMKGNTINMKVAVPTVTPIAMFFLSHAFYLGFTKFSYSYNLKVNLTFAIVSSVAWLLWSIIVRSRQPYVWKVALSILSGNLLTLLEVFDFPPVWWVFDAHSIWHGGTAPLAFVFYSFVIDDCLYLYEEYKKTPDYRRKGV
ncbi:post-GPI attachment to proteins factor 3-like [Patiria miniata]|uniref:Post-GPI attachment to proteins factor 3 n=1 Tax=Patiria miniata TaxID=46514 RepID=A0A914A0S4_PATMI|nr:post-GPI attachment to proteins factor 3-like [Patiria miniata]XP_038044709.1 post-GPI attachment to proteins factor 3-like [Patiria miniata]XP_038044710.1 post-GPI attachment to proteins factor 3-like [Patiria miniata]XP_038044711.1 post-GPI attachment to proteins factor 3-like [Patiria miniata]XP_038057274.1 post-GPI attachment to proteins factor 3-like [Patiria miniata]XP_038057276.1 post-GPI attachment to proteins factor 3-like [Patiria miniata]XP_038057277.1 post-GPI attachment to pro